MTKILRTQTLFLLGSFLVLAACSNNTSRINKSARCPANYNPLIVENNRNYSNKVELKPGGPLHIPSADYAYTGSEVYYNNPERDIRIHLRHEKNNNNEMVVNVVCVSGTGIRPNMEKLEVNLPITSDLFVAEDGSTLIRTRSFHLMFDTSSGKDVFEKSVNTETTTYTPGSPLDLYSDYPDVNQYFVTLAGPNKNSRQLISHIDQPIFNQKSGHPDKVLIRIGVNMRPVTSEERNKIDHPDDEINSGSGPSSN